MCSKLYFDARKERESLRETSFGFVFKEVKAAADEGEAKGRPAFCFLFKVGTPLIHNKKIHGLEAILILDQIVMLAQFIQESVMEICIRNE